MADRLASFCGDYSNAFNSDPSIDGIAPDSVLALHIDDIHKPEEFQDASPALHYPTLAGTGRVLLTEFTAVVHELMDHVEELRSRQFICGLLTPAVLAAEKCLVIVLSWFTRLSLTVSHFMF